MDQAARPDGEHAWEPHDGTTRHSHRNLDRKCTTTNLASTAVRELESVIKTQSNAHADEGANTDTHASATQAQTQALTPTQTTAQTQTQA
eukprot:2035298-Alexandrium_andersonii.AAC.1